MSPTATDRARRARVEERQRIAEQRRELGRDAWWRRGLRMARRGVGRMASTTLVPGAIGALSRSWRVELIGREHFDSVTEGGAYVAVMWHGRMLLPLREHRGRGVGVLVSPSGDGALVARVLGKFGYSVVRGSSSRGGTRALREMAELLRAGTPVVITPDGPRGPRHAMNVGVTWLAREAGVPILPAACACDRAWRASSWDRFTVPKPFARVSIAYGEPIAVPADAGDPALEEIGQRIRDRMLADERSGFDRLGVPFDG